jgi:hypothetical protein
LAYPRGSVRPFVGGGAEEVRGRGGKPRSFRAASSKSDFATHSWSISLPATSFTKLRVRVDRVAVFETSKRVVYFGRLIHDLHLRFAYLHAATKYDL